MKQKLKVLYNLKMGGRVGGCDPGIEGIVQLIPKKNGDGRVGVNQELKVL